MLEIIIYTNIYNNIMVQRSKRFKRRIQESGGVTARTKHIIPVSQIATKRYVKKEIRKDIETKFRDNPISPIPPSTTVNWSGTLYALSDISTGTTDFNRIGDEIVIRSLKFNYSWFQSSATADYTNLCRTIIFQYINNTDQAGGPVATEVLANVGIVTAPLEYQNHDNKQVIKILYDRTHAIGTGMPIVVRRVNVNLKYAKKKIQFTTGGVEGSCKLFVMFITDSSVGPDPIVAWASRLYYDDA